MTFGTHPVYTFASLPWTQSVDKQQQILSAVSCFNKL
jgi:hypothetical protein